MNSRRDDDQRQSNWPRSSTQDRPASASGLTTSTAYRATPSCTLEVARRRPDQSRLNNTTRWQPWNSAQGCSRRLGSAGRSSSDRSLRSSPRSRAAIGGGLFGLVHTVGRELPKGWVPKGWVQTKAGFGQRWVPGAHLSLREHTDTPSLARADPLSRRYPTATFPLRHPLRPLRPVPKAPYITGY